MGLRDTLKGAGNVAAPALLLAAGLVSLDRAIAFQRRQLEELQTHVAAMTDAIGYCTGQVPLPVSAQEAEGQDAAAVDQVRPVPVPLP